MTLSELLAGRAAVAGEAPALTWSRPAVTLTWAEPARRVTSVAAALRRVTEPGQRAAIPARPARRADVDAEATAPVACGHPAGQRIAIIARGYWKRPEESARVFCALITGDDEPRWWLRTGDQGFPDVSGELCVTGRGLVAGCRPEDLEATAEGEVERAMRSFGGSGWRSPRPGAEPRWQHSCAVTARHGLTLRRVVALPSSAGDGPW
ncbi:AMP-binding protein [Amycolatopsis sp. DG1A-15b]|uniref:AMP-binding protein n=1 Tax=Amycolatopsis sp. DG1A-15b TaxID=3052846 RepID=UPI00255BE7A9|nr:AMP-binding protein [Amycolatopsis sp. DG1A-15b]WIX85005.1 AMP-binding protein [Amycolatopsis sp. DG1A-15b]